MNASKHIPLSHTQRLFIVSQIKTKVNWPLLTPPYSSYATLPCIPTSVFFLKHQALYHLHVLILFFLENAFLLSSPYPSSVYIYSLFGFFKQHPVLWHPTGCPTVQLSSDTTWKWHRPHRLRAQSDMTASTSDVNHQWVPKPPMLLAGHPQIWGFPWPSSDLTVY